MPSDFAKLLEERGWKREVAGRDFELGVRILEAMRNSDKGLILSGNYGTGKTSFVNAAFNGFGFYSMPQDEWILGTSQDAKDLGRENIILDDIGSEHCLNEYGVKSERFADFIVRRYAMRDRVGRIVISTNLTTKDFEVRYGGRVVSKLKEMCFAARFTGEDKRKWDIIR